MSTGRKQAPREPAPMEIVSDEGLLFMRRGSDRQLLGFIMSFAETGCYEPNFGKVNVSAEDAALHNSALSTGQILGLDSGCAVGEGGSFYISEGKRGTQVITFTGALVSKDVTIRGQVITFRRRGRIFRGRLSKDANLFNFKRVK